MRTDDSLDLTVTCHVCKKTQRFSGAFGSSIESKCGHYILLPKDGSVINVIDGPIKEINYGDGKWIKQ